MMKSRYEAGIDVDCKPVGSNEEETIDEMSE